MIAIDADPLLIALAVGVVATFVSVIAIVAGSSTARSAAQPSAHPLAATVSSDAVLARAGEAARQQAALARLGQGHTLHAVREARPGGQTAQPPDRDERSRAEATARAAAIAIHVAQHDPQRMAEVIKEWIRTEPGPSAGSH